jgi:hypothetical protein
MQCNHISMKKRDDQITLRLASPLRSELEIEAAACGRSVSNLIRLVLIEHCAQRITKQSPAHETRVG